MRASTAKNPDARALMDDPSVQSQFKADIEELRSRLTAVVRATSDAATTIISGLEHVIAFGDQNDAQNRAFDALSACVFHDIVGQHVARAAELLEIIERLGAVQENNMSGDAALKLAHAAMERRATKMINGPAIEGDASIDQDSIDDFFK